MSEFVYLYGFVPTDASSPADLAGIAGAQVRLIPAGAVHAAVSSVPADEYEPQRIENRLQDLGWVAAQGAAHETVVAWFVDYAEILPVPLFTMYSNDAALRSAVESRSNEYQSELERLRNKREWDVKIAFDERELEKHAASVAPRIAELEAEANAATPGKRYLLEKKRKDLLKSETRAAAQRMARDVLDRARQISLEERVLPIPRTADDLPVIAYSAFLVDRKNEARLVQLFEEEHARFNNLGLSVSFSGPWAAYRFTGVNERAASAGQ